MMVKTAFKKEFHDRRKLSKPRKKYQYFIGVFNIVIGSLGLIKSNTDFAPLLIVLITAGVLSIIYGIVGKQLIKERNYIRINPGEITYKNSFKKPEMIPVLNLLDLRIETHKLEFVLTDHEIKVYDFSVFDRQACDEIINELKRIKSSLIK